MEGIGRAGAQAWNDLLILSRDEAGERPMMERLLDLWRREHGVEAAGLYLERGGRLEQEAAAGDGLPDVLEGDVPQGDGGLGSLQFPGGRLVFLPAVPVAPAGDGSVGTAEGMDGMENPLTLLLAAALKSCRLKYDLKDQQVPVNYRVVELEALYDVGLAVASTLDLDRLLEEILLRAVSLLDARRGALYILEDGRYRLEGTFGGEAAPSFAGGDGELRQFLVAGGEAPAHLLPGARYLPGGADRGGERPAGADRGGGQGEPPRGRPLPRLGPPHPLAVRQPGRAGARERAPPPPRPWRRSASSGRCTSPPRSSARSSPRGPPWSPASS